MFEIDITTVEPVHIALGITASVFALVLLYLFFQGWYDAAELKQHYMLAKVQEKRLPFDNFTRIRLEKARKLFEQGWTALKKEDEAPQSLVFFGQAVELDEVG